MIPLLLILAALATIPAVSFALKLISYPDDFMVAVGLVGLLLLGSLWVVVIKGLITKGLKQLEDL